MAGTTIRILEKNTYTYDSTQLDGSAIVTIPVAVNVDVSRYAYVSLITRVHSFTETGSGANPTVIVNGYASAPTAEDPATLFRFTTAAKITSTAITGPISSGAFTPALDVVGSSANGVVSGFMDFILSIKQSGTAGTLSVAVSIDLVLKS